MADPSAGWRTRLGCWPRCARPRSRRLSTPRSCSGHAPTSPAAFWPPTTLTTTGQTAAFLAGSLVADLGIAALVSAVVLWLCGTRRCVRVQPHPSLAVLVAVSPLAIGRLRRVRAGLLSGRRLRSPSDVRPGGARRPASSSPSRRSTCHASVPRRGRQLFAGRRPGWLSPALDGAAGIGSPGAGRTAGRCRGACWSSRCSSRRAIRRAAATCSTTASGASPPASGWAALVNRLSDVDRDGFGLLGRPPDQALFDARIQPVRAATCPATASTRTASPATCRPARRRTASVAAPAAPWATPPDVILFVLESFRADALGATVGGQPGDAGAGRAGGARRVVVEPPISHNGYTVQSRQHIFTGSLADLRGGTTLIDDFKANGYETAYFSGQDESFGGARRRRRIRAGRRRLRRAGRTATSATRTFTTAGSLAVPYDVLVGARRAVPGTPQGRVGRCSSTSTSTTRTFPYHHARHRAAA